MIETRGVGGDVVGSVGPADRRARRARPIGEPPGARLTRDFDPVDQRAGVRGPAGGVSSAFLDRLPGCVKDWECMRTAIYPGSFDPLTNGHLSIIQRGVCRCSIA